jgi:hypothetical protein
MPGFGIFGRKKKGGDLTVGVAKKGVGAVDSTGFSEKQKKALKAGKKSKALSAIDRRRKAMAEIMGN